MVFQIEFSDTARRDLRKIDGPIQNQIFKKLDEMAPLNSIYCENLSIPNLCKIRVGQYRIVIQSDLLASNLIFIVMIGKKSKIYKRLGIG